MNCVKITNRNLWLWITSIATFALTLVLVVSLAATEVTEVNASNMASSYTKYSIHYGIGEAITAKPRYSYKDVWNSSYTTTRNVYNSNWKFVDSWQGPTEMTREEKVTTGTQRTTSWSVSGEKKDCAKATIGYTYSTSKSTEVKKTFKFPGDNKLHTLYVTRRHIDRENYTWRTSYRATPISYTWLPGVASWNIKWGAYSRYSARDIAKFKSAATTEYQFGSYMN